MVDCFIMDRQAQNKLSVSAQTSSVPTFLIDRFIEAEGNCSLLMSQCRLLTGERRHAPTESRRTQTSGQVRAVSVAWEETGIMWIGGVTAVYHTKIVSEYHLYSVDACGA